MSTRANVVIEYQDQDIGVPSELWLYHHHDGNVRGIGEEIVRAVNACGFVGNGDGLERLWDMFPQVYENVMGLQSDVEFLYRITYADNKVTVVARHGGYVGEQAGQHYRRENDMPDNSVELYNAMFEGVRPVSFGYDIREPESYVRTLMEDSRAGERAWRGRLR